MLKIYNEQMQPIGYEDKKKVHQEGLWHKSVGGILYCPKERKVYFQTIFPKESYTFEREDYIDFSIGGHIEEDETELEALLRESKEELGLEITEIQAKFLSIRVCNCDLSESYKIREFQYFYSIELAQEFQDFNFELLDKEIKSLVEMDIDDFTKLLLQTTPMIKAVEIIPDRENKKSLRMEIEITNKRIVPDYFSDQCIKDMMQILQSM